MAEQNPSEHVPGASDVIDDGPSAKRPCMKDTPPIASTPVDDGSDFYNTPWAAGTPVDNSSENKDTTDTDMTSEPTISSKPASLIPGLSLINDSLQDPQPAKEESAPAQDVHNEMAHDMTTGKEVTKKDAQHAAETTNQVQTAPASEDAQPMDVEPRKEQAEQEEAKNQPAEEPRVDETNTNDAAPGTLQDHEAEEEEGEHPEWEIDSSPYESSSDDSTTDSSDDSDDEDDDYPILSAEETARILMMAENGSDDEGEGKGRSGGNLRTANEVPEEAPPIPEITVTPDMKIVHLGHVESIVENTLLIAANVSGEYQVLESGSLLCLEGRTVAGVVSETLGRVENPLYAVRFPSAAAIEERGLSKGKNVYYVEEHSTFVFTQPLKGLKGSDASNFHDEEVGEDEIEFSDDEAEAEYKRRLKQKRQERKEARNENGGPSRGRRGPPGPSKLSQTELNYDDSPTAEDGYTPLARPKNLHEMMSQQEAPVEGEGSSRNPPFRGGRGRGRGSDRGRGNRGRGAGGSRETREHSSYHDRSSYPQQQRPFDAQAQPSNYSQQPSYPPAQQNVYGMPQQFAPFQPFAQQPQQAFPQSASPTQFNFQMPFQQAYQQPNPYQNFPAINPLFLAAMQQQQQQQQQPQQHTSGQPQVQNPTMNFDQVKAQLDLLRHLSNANQGPPRP
ncbi:RNA-binding snoRNP assembly protein NAF1 [Aspergillus fischeri NRRL 181]|uniref:H/ACA ribonucleoprotein complex non-core subunit NAF1 n=1 Tax=Neosartorya fischeri (strain ATCC 1020 / DSM 3700 / CBS 544.65 / FGSC A1164 / JCM 1740 / NRRL 181 / WB 181) TaxID=331117 RepID=A1D228_NEOFI|nr:snoRNP assembly factor Naf1, putative [Aspergillus fischeri NRRL 181]EAW22471.1 snoRNP assembly factor Naf1, putative [Aspergillus fischeri NRRL 181]